jgi:hypothetical protein
MFIDSKLAVIHNSVGEIVEVGAMQRSAIDGSRASGNRGKRVVVEPLRNGKFSGVRVAPRFQPKDREIDDDGSDTAEPGTKRKTPLTDRITRATGHSQSERTEEVPPLANLRKFLFE